MFFIPATSRCVVKNRSLLWSQNVTRRRSLGIKRNNSLLPGKWRCSRLMPSEWQTHSGEKAEGFRRKIQGLGSLDRSLVHPASRVSHVSIVVSWPASALAIRVSLLSIDANFLEQRILQKSKRRGWVVSRMRRRKMCSIWSQTLLEH